MTEKVLLAEKKGHILDIILNRPDRYNALSNELMDLLLEALENFAQDPELHVAVLRGAGKNFSSGADIKEFANAKTQTEEAIHHRGETSFKIHTAFHAINKPIISSVRGYALAGGCGLALGCDLVVASENAVFGYVEVKRNIVPALVLSNLSKLVGRRKALEYVMTGRRVTAAEALQVGMINYMVPDDKLEARTWELAEELAALHPHSVGTIKELFYKVADMELDEGLKIGRDAHVAMRKTKEFSKGVSNFGK